MIWVKRGKYVWVRKIRQEYRRKWYQLNKEKLKEYYQHPEAKARRYQYNQEQKENQQQYYQKNEVVQLKLQSVNNDYQKEIMVNAVNKIADEYPAINPLSENQKIWKNYL